MLEKLEDSSQKTPPRASRTRSSAGDSSLSKRPYEFFSDANNSTLGATPTRDSSRTKQPFFFLNTPPKAQELLAAGKPKIPPTVLIPVTFSNLRSDDEPVIPTLITPSELFDITQINLDQPQRFSNNNLKKISAPQAFEITSINGLNSFLNKESRQGRVKYRVLVDEDFALWFADEKKGLLMHKWPDHSI